MAIRFTINGVEYTVDRAEEAAELTKTLGRQNAAQKAAATRWQAGAGNGRPQAAVPKKKSVGTNRVFSRLFHAERHELRATELADREAVSVAAIPPLMRNARWWAGQAEGTDVDLSHYIQKRMSASGETIYSLTDLGLELAKKAEEGN